MRTYNLRVMLLVLIMAVVAVGNSPVSADVCNIQPSSLAYAASPSYASGVIVPVSVTCSFVGGQLSAVGDATDASTNAHVGSANTGLSSAYGTNIYTGQLAFSLPPEVSGHTLRISISIYSGMYNGPFYNGPYGNASPLTTSVETVQVNFSNYYSNYANCYYSNNCAPVYNACQSPSSNGTTQCVGYLYQDPNGCVELVMPIYSAIGLLSYRYYTLQKLPASYPAIGTWVSVGGQLSQGFNYAPNGAACPGNYITVSSIGTK